jgi:hypothetical protein
MIFKPTRLCLAAIRVEAYKAQTGFTQCYKWQKFGHAWHNCKQPTRCMWCGGGYLHKCPEKGNAETTPKCCNWKLVDGEEPHPSNYRRCSHVRDETRKNKSQRASNTTTGRVFSSSRSTPGLSFAAAMRSNTEQQ